MSNGTRLIAVVVVVVLAAIGLYYAFLFNPSGTPPRVPVPINSSLTDGSVSPAAPPVGGLGASRSGTIAGEAVQPVAPPPSGAFAPPTGAAAAHTSPKSAPPPSPTSASSPVPVGSSTPGSTHAPATSTPGATPAAGTTEYTIQSGDTFESLARRFLGDSSKSKMIQDANPGTVATSLKIGQKIRIPGGTTSTGTATTGTTTNSGAASASTANTYTVQKGDSLMGISRKLYGSETDFKRILDANASLLKGNANAIQPGMKLTIPAKK